MSGAANLARWHAYMDGERGHAVLAVMLSGALLARLPTLWTAIAAVLFAVSDGMIGVGRFLLESQALELPIWWVYAASMVLITAGLFFGRSPE